MIFEIKVTHQISEETQEFLKSLANPVPSNLPELVLVLSQQMANMIGAMSIMSQTLEQLRADVAANTAIATSAVALINGLADRIDEAAGDETALAALSAELRANNTSLAAAVEENTPPAAPPPAEEPTPAP